VRWALLLALAAGCSGFQPVAGADLSSPGGGGGDDAAVPDPGLPDGGAPPDLLLPRDADVPDGYAIGPGALGALPTGYCCHDDSECRGRRCVTPDGGGSAYCADFCRDDAPCAANLPGYACDTYANTCTLVTAGVSCTPANLYTHGHRPLGACCTASSGRECEGGLCLRTGDNLANPMYCTMGCKGSGECDVLYWCPADPGYFIDERWCEKTFTRDNPLDPYTCD
jgi:hypothetical protein